MSDSRSISDDAKSSSQKDIVPIPVVTSMPPQYVVAPNPQMPFPPAKQKKPGAGILIAGIILCIVALAALATTLILFFFNPFSSGPAPQPPSASEVEQAFKKATIEKPKLDDFAYIKQGELSDPELSGFKAGSVSEDGSSKGTFICNGEAEATFESDSVKVVVPLTLRMTRGSNANAWTDSGIDQGSPVVTPKGPADVDAMVKNIQMILKSYKQEVAEKFVDCKVEPEASLTAEGGTVIFNLSKTSGDETQTCTVKANVTWGSKGWEVKVTEITGLPDEEVPAPEESNKDKPASGNSGGNSGNSGGSSSNPNPTMLLECWSGDLVRVPGTIQIQSNGSVLLRTDDVIKVVFDNKVFITTHFEITGSGRWQNGQHVTLDGAISATGNNPVAPLVINTSYQ